MGLVQDDVKEFFLQEDWQALLHFFVIDDHHIIFMELFKKELTLALSSFDNTYALSFKELLYLILPIVCKSRRANYQVAGTVNHASMLLDLSLFNLFALIKDDTKRLKCLAQTHVITQGTVQVIIAQLRHPVYTFLLVISEFHSGILLHRNDKLVLRNDAILCKNCQELEPFLSHLSKCLANRLLATLRLLLSLFQRGNLQWKKLNQLGKDLHDTLVCVMNRIYPMLGLDSFDNGKDKHRQVPEEEHCSVRVASTLQLGL